MGKDRIQRGHCQIKQIKPDIEDEDQIRSYINIDINNKMIKCFQRIY